LSIAHRASRIGEASEGTKLPVRTVLAPSQREGFLAIPNDIPQIEIERYYTFTAEERQKIRAKRRGHNRLGFAVQWAYLRFPGRPWEPAEWPPDSVLFSIAEQIGVVAAELAHYSEGRDTTRREHLHELFSVGVFRPYDAQVQREMTSWLLPVALSTDSGVTLLEALVIEMRSRRMVLPLLSVLERMVWEVRRAAQGQVAEELTRSLTQKQRAQLEALFHTEEKRSPHQAMLTWVRQISGRATPSTIIRFLERIEYLKQIGLPLDQRQVVHQNRLRSLAREGGRLSPQHLSRLVLERRHAILVAFVRETIAQYTDQVLLMHERMIQQMMRRGEQGHEEAFQKSGRAINEKVRLLVRVGKALISAKVEARDPFAAIESVISWEAFQASVTEAEALARSPNFDYLEGIDQHYRPIRRYAPLLLETLEFRATTAMQPLLAALDILRRLYRDEIRKIPPDAPSHFIRERWKPYVFTASGIDRRYYELCTLTELRQALRSGDIFVSGSRLFRDVEEHLLDQKDVRKLVADLPVEEAVEDYLERRRQEVEEALLRVERQIKKGELEGVRFERDRLILSPLPSAIPPEAEEQTRRAYEILPPIKITDLLVEVDRWTHFTQHFTALRQGTPVKDPEALLTAILAEATNLGPVKMAMATPGMTYGRLAKINDWYVRDETYAGALAQIINAQHQQELTALWGRGTTSSSDAQRFPVGGRRENRAQVNARYGSGPGVLFYTHISDRYAPFHTKVINAGARDATHVLDGLLYHETDLSIEEHYTDTAGYTEQVFALCHLLGFRFAPRIRDLADKKLFVMGNPEDYPALTPLLGGTIQEKQIRQNWSEVLRLAASIQKGAVTASLILSKLASYPRQNNLAVALREIGRIERTLFTLDWLQSPDLRRRVTVGLNKGEARHALARAVFFYRRGMVQERNFEEMENRASGLNLVVAAIILWNTVKLRQAVQQLEMQNTPLPESCLPHLSPLVWDHILLTGEYRWSLQT